MTIVVPHAIDVVEPRIDVLAHQVLLVHQQQHEDQYRGHGHSVHHLGKNRNLHQRQVGHEDYTRASDNQDGIQPVEHRRFR